MQISLDMNSKKPLYELIYEALKTDILTGTLKIGEKLPSKRSFAEQFDVSLVTVANAYEQLIAEGYVRAEQRSGYYVQYSGGVVELNPLTEPIYEEMPPDDESAETIGVFPFSVWTRLMRRVILEKGTALLQPVQNGGAYELRSAISGYLYRARGLYQPPERIIIGSGAEYMYNLLIQLLGRDKRYAAENPGFPKLPKIYTLNDVNFELISLDKYGVNVSELLEKRVDIAHISPAHHFPTGIVMPISRRLELARWAMDGGKFIIEDEYDSEFRWSGKPLPALFGQGAEGRIIYINTFSQTIAPSVRISYMCLPEELYEQWQQRLGFYACSVPVFEQFTLAKFISERYFERHLSRVKKHFRRVRELVIRLLERFDGVEISESNAGLHFTVRISEDSERIVSECEQYGIKITPISQYYVDNSLIPIEKNKLFVVNFASANEERLKSGLIK
ncbi:MAG: PLP-dependent aminotransferase family protein [Oscillospiraceae bacterium]|nr:PLP-dependent aminotransferase family protein [Oscillospiraceae bacterium]